MTPVKWPYQSASYLSALPGLVGPGLDVSAGDKISKLYFITSLADTKDGGPDPRGPNCFAGTARYCWMADQGEGFHKFIIPLVGGYAYLGRSVLSAKGRGDLDYIGHAAPGAGLFIRCGTLNVLGGSNVRLWHLPVWVGDEPAAAGVTNFHAGNRDALQASADGLSSKAVAFINCEARFTMDEGVQVFYAADGVSWIRGAIFDPLHVPPAFGDSNIVNHEPGTDHGYGQIIGGSEFCDHTLTIQSLYAHTTDRNPLASSNNHAHVNNLHYNHGRPGGGSGAGLNISDNGGHNALAKKGMSCNMVGCMSVRGPDNNESLVFAQITNALPTGSSGHAAMNLQYGWQSPATQDGFFTKRPDWYLKPTLRRSAWPDGLGHNYSGVLPIAADPLAPTAQEGLAFSYLMRTTVGCMPARRYLYQGGLNTVFDQIDNAIRGVKADSQYVNTVLEAGDWPCMPAEVISDDTAAQWWHSPFPIGADRDEVLLDGVFSDGSSKIGYSKLRAWCIEQYLATQGR